MIGLWRTMSGKIKREDCKPSLFDEDSITCYNCERKFIRHFNVLNNTRRRITTINNKETKTIKTGLTTSVTILVKQGISLLIVGKIPLVPLSNLNGVRRKKDVRQV